MTNEEKEEVVRAIEQAIAAAFRLQTRIDDGLVTTEKPEKAARKAARKVLGLD